MPAQYTVVAQLAHLTTNSIEEHRKKTFLEAAWVGVRKRGWVHVGKDWYKPPRYLSAKLQCLLIAFVTPCAMLYEFLCVITLVFCYRPQNSMPKPGTASVFSCTTYLYFSSWLWLQFTLLCASIIYQMGKSGPPCPTLLYSRAELSSIVW